VNSTDDGISPNVVGALDGKHIVIQKLSNSGSMFYTYKHTFAIQLLALLDADYNFIYVHVGCQGRIGDAGVFHHSSLSKALAQDTLGIPDRTLVVQGNWRGDKSSRGMVNVLPVRGNQRSNAKAMHDELAEYFVNEGSVSWQWQHAHSVSL